MSTHATVTANKLLREQALVRAQALRREALRATWDAVGSAWRRFAAGRAARRPARIG
jgi:hypothetical protein